MLTSSVFNMESRIFPIAVLEPTATTSALALPETTIVPCKRVDANMVSKSRTKKILNWRSSQDVTENRMLVLSWYTALVTLVVSNSFSTEQLSPMRGPRNVVIPLISIKE